MACCKSRLVTAAGMSECYTGIIIVAAEKHSERKIFTGNNNNAG